MQLDRASCAIASLESEMNALQRYTRGFNIRILGLPENDEVNCVTWVENLLHDHFNTEGSIIENVHGVGTANRGKPTPIIARFFSRTTRLTVMANAREKLQGSPYRFTDDPTPRDLQEKRRLTTLMNDLFQKKLRPRFTNGRLYTNGKIVPREMMNNFLATESD